MFAVYILRSLKTGKHYIGSTQNLQRRLSEHNAGKSSFAKGNTPFEIIFTEEYQTKSEAVHREFQIKSYKGGTAFRKLISTNE